MTAVRHLRADAPNHAVPGRRDRTRAALIRAGEALMANRSVDAISIDEIVETAGVAKGTFYNHFPDKEALQQAALEVIRGDVKQTIARHNSHVTDPARRVARAFCVALRYAMEHPQRGNFQIRTSMAFRLIDEKMNEGLIQDIGIGLAEGRFVIASTESGALLMLGITQAAMARALEQEGDFSITARTQQMGAMLLRGLGLQREEAEMISAQETDHIICAHDFKSPSAQ